MGTTLWVLTAILAFGFASAGVMKLLQPQEKLANLGMEWVNDFGSGTVKQIGVLEILGAIGLIVPAAVGVVPVLVPIAAVGLAAVMLGAAVVHARRKEVPMIAVNAVLFAIAVVVAWGRFGPYAFGS
jgi:uncharacterized membrane protein YphA (DoxX/SURF4 family)